MPTGITASGRRAVPRQTARLGATTRAEIVAEWGRNLEAIGFDLDDPEYWTPMHISYHLRQAGLPTQQDMAERYNVSPCLISHLVRGVPYTQTQQGERPPRPTPLTDIQLAFLDRMANGLRQYEISYATGRSSTNVSFLMSRIRQRLRAHSDAHAVAIAVARGWVTVKGV